MSKLHKKSKKQSESSKRDFVGVHLPASTKETLAKVAKANRRSVSAQSLIFLEEGVRRHFLAMEA